MSVRGTVLLVAVLAVLAGYLVLVELPTLRRPPVPRDLPDTPPLLAVAPAQVARVEIDDGGGAVITAVRRDGGWIDGAGQAWSRDTISDLIQTLTTIRPVMVIDPVPATPNDYGLGAHARRLRLSAADGTTVLALEIGDRNPAWTGLYARVGDRPEVVLVGGVLRWELEKVHDSAP